MKLKNFLLFKYYQLLWRLARKYLKKWQPLVIGINGSVGKTSCRMIVYEVLQAHLWEQLSIYTSPKNFNGELGMSLSIFKITEWTPSIKGMINTLQTILTTFKSNAPKPYDVLILEYGIDRPQEMEFLCSIAKPHISILTKLDAVHSLQFGTAEDIAKEELKLQKNTLLHCYINTSDTHGMTIAKHLKTKITYYHTDEREPKQGDVSTDHYTIQNNTNPTISSPIISQSLLHYRQQEISFTTNIVGKIHHDYVALAYDIVEVVRNQYNLWTLVPLNELMLQLQPGRMSIFHGIHDSIIIDSSYNSSPLSLKKVIEESNNLHNNLYPDAIRIYILGDMRELGESETDHHRELAHYLQSLLKPSDIVILLWQAMTTTYSILNDTHWICDNVYHYTNFHEVSKRATTLIEKLSHNNKQSFVIVKGSQNTIFLEEVVKSLLADKSDSQYLTRQWSWWEDKKWL